MNIDGEISDLVVGRSYRVEALEWRRDGICWAFIRTAVDTGSLRPYPLAFFSVLDGDIPSGWVVTADAAALDRSGISLMGPREWTEDFFERLIDDDPEALEIYRRICLFTSE